MICLSYSEIASVLLGGIVGAFLCGFIQAWFEHRKAQEK
jgi:fructose-specific phosphotransferase system IIC component